MQRPVCAERQVPTARHGRAGLQGPHSAKHIWKRTWHYNELLRLSGRIEDSLAAVCPLVVNPAGADCCVTGVTLVAATVPQSLTFGLNFPWQDLLQAGWLAGRVWVAALSAVQARRLLCCRIAPLLARCPPTAPFLHIAQRQPP